MQFNRLTSIFIPIALLISLTIAKPLVFSGSARSSASFFQVNNFAADSGDLSLDTTKILTESDIVSVHTLEINEKKGPLEAKVDYVAKDSMQIDLINRTIYLFGGAEVKYQDINLKAERVIYNIKDNLLIAYGIKDSLDKQIGRPIFSEKDRTFEADTITYNFKTKKGIIKEVKTQEGEGFLHSAVTKKQENDDIHIGSGKYTTCSLDHPHYYFGMKKAIAIPKEKIIAGPTQLVVEDVPTPLIIPFGYFPNKKNRSSGIIIPAYGDSESQGFFLRGLGYYIPISDYWDTKFLADMYFKGSWTIRNSTNYRKRYKYSGGFGISKGTNIDGLKELPDSYKKQNTLSINWNHRQDAKARPNSTFGASVNFVSSNYYQGNLANDINDYLQSNYSSNINYTKSFKNTPFSLNGSSSLNQNRQTRNISFTLPNIGLQMTRINPFAFIGKNNVGSKAWYKKIGLNYSSELVNRLSVGDTTLHQDSIPYLLDQMRSGVKHNASMSTSFNLLKNKFYLSPSINYAETWHFKTVDKIYDPELDTLFTDTISGFKRHYTYSTSLSLNTKLYGFFGLMDLFKVRHVMTPSVSVSFNPDFGDYKTYFNPVVENGDTIIKEQEYSPFEISSFPASLSRESGSISYSLNNNLEAKIKNKKDTITGYTKVKLIENFSLSTSYDMFREKNKWSDVRFSARTTLFQKFSVNFGGSYDPYDYDTVKFERIDNSAWSTAQGIGKITNTNLSLSFGLQGKTNENSKKEENKDNQLVPQADLDWIESHYDEYIDLNIPWSLSVNYNFGTNYIRSKDSLGITQSLTFSGDVSLTDRWKVGVSSGYDFTNRGITSNTSLNIHRDLHCWEISARWTPMGTMKSYELRLNIKSAMLQQLKLTKKNNWFDNR